MRKTSQRAVPLLLTLSLVTGMAGQTPTQQQRRQPVNRPLSIAGKILPAAGEAKLPPMVMVTIEASGGAYNKTQMATAGSFRFDDVPAGNYTLTLVAEGYRSAQMELNEWSSQGGERYISLSLGPRTADGELASKEGLRIVDARIMAIPEKAKKELEKATEQSQKNSLDKALKHLQTALEIHPEFPEAFNNLGALYLKMGRRDEAEQAFSRAIEFDPDSAAALKNLGFIYLTTDREEMAIEPLSKAAVLNPSDVNTQAFLGEALFQTAHYKEAVPPLTKALELDPTFFRSSYRLGYVYLKLEQYPDALGAFQQFLKTNKGMNESAVRQIVTQLQDQFPPRPQEPD